VSLVYCTTYQAVNCKIISCKFSYTLTVFWVQEHRLKTVKAGL